MLAADAGAQPSDPLEPFVVDARGTLARFKADPGVAASLDVPVTNLPTRGLGLTLGAHWYPIRGRLVSLGLGGEMLFARDSRTDDPEDEDTTASQRPVVTTRLSAFSPQVSLNFGKREGWSYVTVGIGRARLTSQRDDEPFSEAAARTRSLNYGGGARWFTGPRLAFAVDLRFYTVNAREATSGIPGYPKMRLMILSAGISLH
jgi:hypothetical protein